MSGKGWIALIVFGLCFLGGGFFYFLGSFFSLFKDNSLPQKGNIAIVEVLGPILESKDTVEILRKLKKEDKAKAVILRIDSPGGSVGASQEIYEAVKELKKTKPVVASMGTVAASGGYYIAAPCSKIVANEGTATGSIGVRMELVNVEELLTWAKVHPSTLVSGAMKDVGSPTRPMTPEEKDYLESLLKKMHGQFKKAISDGRGISMEELDKIADGRVYTGSEAKDLKLVDELGGLETAISVAANLAAIKEEPEVYYKENEKNEFLEKVLESSIEKVFQKLLISQKIPSFSY
ncbi:MAG: signal peptide peptidase SppA [Deltaproteobacteria bacterium]|nr:MAG: signal peptide peptidase SppA [Deltaproteobacteria bacterium]